MYVINIFSFWLLPFPVNKRPWRLFNMTLHLQLAPLISLAAGIGILVFPKLLNYIVAAYLIVIGVVGLTGLSI